MGSIYIGAVGKYFISSLDPSLDVRSIDPAVYDVWREDSFLDIMNIASRKEPVTQPFYVSWTNTQLFYRPQVASVTSSAGANPIVVVTTSATAGQARIGQVVYLKNNTSGYITGVTYSGSGDTVTITTDSGTPLSISANDYLNLGGITVGERSIAPKNVGYGYNKYSNKIQLFRETSQISDVQMEGKLEAEIDGNDTFMWKDHIDKLKLLKGGMNLEFILGQISTTSFSDANPALVDPNSNSAGGGGAVQRSRGLYQYITNYGTVLSAIGSGTSGSPVPNGTTTLADFDNICDALLKARAPLSQMCLAGSSVLRSFSKLFKDLGSSGVNSVRLVVDGKELDLEVDKVTYGGFDFTFSPMGIMNHPNVSTTTAGKSALFVPGDFRVSTYTEGKGVDQKPALGMRYYRNNQVHGNELIGESYTGTLAPYPNGEVREWRTTWEAGASLEFKTPSFGVALQVNA